MQGKMTVNGESEGTDRVATAYFKVCTWKEYGKS
jgi:hypothetical protein